MAVKVLEDFETPIGEVTFMSIHQPKKWGQDAKDPEKEAMCSITLKFDGRDPGAVKLKEIIEKNNLHPQTIKMDKDSDKGDFSLKLVSKKVPKLYDPKGNLVANSTKTMEEALPYVDTRRDQAEASARVVILEGTKYNFMRLSSVQLFKLVMGPRDEEDSEEISGSLDSIITKLDELADQ